jgi:hypothetical protein
MRWRDEAAMQAHAKASHLGAFAAPPQSAKPQGMSVKACSGGFQRALMEAPDGGSPASATAAATTAAG